jgi:hypothetical protein
MNYPYALLFLVGALLAFGVLAPAALAAPANDEFAAAQVLNPATPTEASGDNTGATKEAGEPNHAGEAGGHSVWFSWTPAESGRVGISYGGCFAPFTPVIGVYTGEAVNALASVASSAHLTPTCFGEGAQVEWDALAGTTYRIAADGTKGATGAFSFTVNGAPANDDFADATTISAQLPQNVFGSTRYAGAEAGEPEHAGQPGGRSLWWSWTPETSSPVVVSTCSSFYALDTLLAVYSGESLGSLTKVAANDDAPAPTAFPGCAATNSEVRFEAEAGTTYRIAVDSTGASPGRFSLSLHGRPANDDFVDATTLSPNLPLGPNGTTDLATAQANEPADAGQPALHSVWYSWTPNASGRVFLSVCSQGLDPQDFDVAAYTGSSLATLAPVSAETDGASYVCSASDKEVSFIAAAGTTYLIAVDSKDAGGTFSLQLQGAPANDDFAAAQVIGASLPSGAFGSTRAASEQPGEPQHGGPGGAHSIWYSWTPATSGPVVLSDCPYNESNAVSLLAVYTGDSLTSLTPVVSDDGSGASCGPNAGQVSFDAEAGTTYKIAVDGRGGTAGIFSLEIEGRPANDDFAAATVLPAAPMTAGANNRLATKQSGEPSHAGDAGGHSLWFSWTPETSGPAYIAACGYTREIDPLLAVYTGSGLGSLTEVAANDDGPGTRAFGICEAGRGDSSVEFDALAGNEYRIAVDGASGSVGRFTLAFERAPANDDFAASQQLSGPMPIFASTDIRLAGKEPGEPDHSGDPGGHSVWYSWTAPSNGDVALDACDFNGDFDPLLAVYTGSSLGALTTVAAGGQEAGDVCHGKGSEAGFTATAGTTYRIELDGVVSNDDFNQPRSLGGGRKAETFDSSRFATKQAGEPGHAADPGGASIWFKWTAPKDAEVSIDTCGSGFDTLLAVYEGSELGALTPVAASDDSTGKCAPQSRLAFGAVANTTYRIAVDGKNGAQGPVHLTIDARPRNDDFAAAERISGALGWYVPGTTRLATKQAGEPNHGSDPGGHSVWFSWTPAKTAAVELDVCSPSLDPVLGVYTGADLGALEPVPTTDAGLGGCEEGRSFGFDVTAGTTYRLAVDGAGGDEGAFEMHLRPAIEHARLLDVDSAGDGSVVSAPAALNCSSHCSYAFEVGETVTLKAEPSPGSNFAGWSGAGCSGTGACEVTLNTDATVVANFAGTSAGGGGGGVTIPPPPPLLTPNPKPNPTPKPLHCKPGFKKARVHGKPRCVKKPKRRHGKLSHSTR